MLTRCRSPLIWYNSFMQEKSRIVVFTRLFLTLIVLLLSTGLVAPVRAQTETQLPAQQAADLLQQMTPEERIGQLFLTTFKGNTIGPDSPISNLISKYHLGGVVILRDNDNIVPPKNPADNDGSDDRTAIPQQVYNLIDQLQQAEWQSSQTPQIEPVTGERRAPEYIPLWIGMAQEGDGYPYDQILTGLTRLPNQMAIGATWKPELAGQVGDTLGRELSILGVNLLLGPSLDVLEAPQLDVTNNLGTRTFGGDPYWVGKMGQAYIQGIHNGSGGRVVVAARHFPGHGSSDRLPEEEVATVRKSLDELQSFDLAPFYAVTGSAPSSAQAADALMTSHIRYQGLQGNIRATTRPVSFDPQALGLLLGLETLSTWRDAGGVLISDDLGNLAVRRFYDLTNQTFDARRVALNAFLAGNDLLYIADFSSTDAPDSYTEAIRTLAFFTQKYREDAAFAQRVDASVLRLLTLKYRLYETFEPQQLVAPGVDIQDLGQGSAVTFDVARRAATLLSPTQAELDSLIPDPPNQNDRIIFISDTHTAQQCSTCPELEQLSATALKDAVLRLYGPQAGGSVNPSNLSSYSFDELQAMLDAGRSATFLERDLARANWIVVALLGKHEDQPTYQTLQTFLTDRPDLFQDKRLIVFSFSAPYYLDATNISKLTAYYALYSQSQAFIDVAAYLLFGELRATGAPPVSVAGISYNLNNALFPNPVQGFLLEFDLPAPTQPVTGTLTPEPPAVPEYRAGDVVPLRTGVILDYNGNPVPDGTPVVFVISYGSETSSTRQVAYTTQGVARTTYLVPQPGSLELRAESENAASNILRIDIPFPSGEVTASPGITELPPTATPTVKPTQSNPTPTDEPEIEAPTQTEPTLPPPSLGDWVLSIVTAGLLGLGIFRYAMQAGMMRWSVRMGLMVAIGGIAAYLYLALNLPGADGLMDDMHTLNVFWFTIIGAAIGLLAALGWRAYTNRERTPPGEDI